MQRQQNTLRLTTRSCSLSLNRQAARSISLSTLRRQAYKRNLPDESTLAGAQHKPSLSGPSLGHLISELSATTPQMLKDGIRTEGQTMNEGDRTYARRITMGLVGIPIAAGTALVGAKWFMARSGE